MMYKYIDQHTIYTDIWGQNHVFKFQTIKKNTAEPHRPLKYPVSNYYRK